tara:strand:- start:1579 stop:1911 length:333 start_codon:yes stop_codon:yes gene_type:complete
VPSKIQFGVDELIFEEGDKGEAAYLVMSGEVWLLKGSEPSQSLLDIKNKGQIFGELALFDNAPRFATAVAKTAVICMAISKSEFENLVAKGDKDPIMKSLIQAMKAHKRA